MNGKTQALKALSGQVPDRVLVGLFTWAFEYTWRVANLAPWKLALGSSETWRLAHLALYNRHQPDLLWYEGGGSGPREPTLLEEKADRWIVRDENTGGEYDIIKNSLSVCNRTTGGKTCDPVGAINTPADADRLIPLFETWGECYLAGLNRLTRELADRALVIPHHSPAYICACYALGFERAMELMLTDPNLFLYVADRFAAGDRLRMRQWKQAGAEACFIADGWASCDIISRDMFRQFALPYQKAIIQAAHDEGLKVILWNEGDILPILDLEANLEMDGFAFEQPRKGVEVTVGKVRNVFGPNRCLFGNLDSELLLMRNDQDEINIAVRRQFEESGPGNPFIFSTGSPIPSNVNPRIIDQIFQTIRSL